MAPAARSNCRLVPRWDGNTQRHQHISGRRKHQGQHVRYAYVTIIFAHSRNRWVANASQRPRQQYMIETDSDPDKPVLPAPAAVAYSCKPHYTMYGIFRLSLPSLYVEDLYSSTSAYQVFMSKTCIAVPQQYIRIVYVHPILLLPQVDSLARQLPSIIHVVPVKSVHLDGDVPDIVGVPLRRCPTCDGVIAAFTTPGQGVL